MQPKMSEYSYLRSLAYDQYEARLMEQVDPIQEQIFEALKEGDFDRAMALESERTVVAISLFQERIRAEDVIRWLEIDTLLRQEGRNYPDVFENLSLGYPQIEGVII